MKLIRNDCFETNSSSNHSIALGSKDTNYILDITSYRFNNERNNHLYFGYCPSINEFRKLCKMLGV